MKIFGGYILFIMLGNTYFSAQNCSDFYYFRKDGVVTFIQYDSKGNILGKNIEIIKNISLGKGIALSDNSIVNYNPEGNVKEELPNRTLCIRNNLKINVSISTLPGIETYLSYPSDMKIGQKLGEDINKSFEISVSERKIEIFYSIIDRKVIGHEIIKTSTGDYKTEKIQYILNVKYNIAGISIPLNKKIIEWFTPGYGIVKKESYSKGGVLEEYAVLSSIEGENGQK